MPRRARRRVPLPSCSRCAGSSSRWSARVDDTLTALATAAADADHARGLWLVALFAVAIGAGAVAGNNQGTVTVYWPPFRVDLSLNLVVLLLWRCCFCVALALQALGVSGPASPAGPQLASLAEERAIHTTLLGSLTHLISGRFVRARKTAEMALALEESVERSGSACPMADACGRFRTCWPPRAPMRCKTAPCATPISSRPCSTVQRDTQDAREGCNCGRALGAGRPRRTRRHAVARPVAGGASRRTVALRLRFRAARLAGKSRMALDTARLLTQTPRVFRRGWHYARPGD